MLAAPNLARLTAPGSTRSIPISPRRTASSSTHSSSKRDGQPRPHHGGRLHPRTPRASRRWWPASCPRSRPPGSAEAARKRRTLRRCRACSHRPRDPVRDRRAPDPVSAAACPAPVGSSRRITTSPCVSSARSTAGSRPTSTRASPRARARAPLTVTLDGLASFGGDRPRAVIPRCAHAGPRRPPGGARAHRPTGRRGAGSRRFTPHVTLARLNREADAGAVARYLTEAGVFAPLTFTAERAALYSARTSRGGGPYLVEAAYPFGLGDGWTRMRIDLRSSGSGAGPFSTPRRPD